MKVILSRKGFDTTSGGRPSVLYDNELISVPIPDHLDGVKYADLKGGEFVKRIEQVFENKPKLKNTDKQFLGQLRTGQCHPDPNLTDYFDAGDDFLGSIGLTQPKKIEQGDVFLFFGLFEDVVTGVKNHTIWGYLEVDKALTPETLRALSDAERTELQRRTGNPHFNPKKYTNEKHNAIYIAKQGGCGVFKYSPELELLDADKKYRHKALNGVIDKNGKPLVLMRGQDFVVDGEQAVEWAKGLIEKHKKMEVVVE